MAEKTKKQSEKSKDWEDWCELYEYVKKEIMGYTQDMKLSTTMILRLKGLNKGQFLANPKLKPMASYDFKTILYTFKICKPKILDWFKYNDMNFKDEQHKFNSSMVFVEREINDVVIRLKKAKKIQEKTENVDLTHMDNEVAEYTKKSKDTKLNDLW